MPAIVSRTIRAPLGDADHLLGEPERLGARPPRAARWPSPPSTPRSPRRRRRARRCERATSPSVESARWIEVETVSAREVSSRAVPTSCSPAAPSSVTELLDSSTAMRRSWIDSLIRSECEYTELIDCVRRWTSATCASVSATTVSRVAPSSEMPAPRFRPRPRTNRAHCGSRARARRSPHTLR